MAQPTILWTCLPNGVEGGKLKFSVVASIRLPEEAGKTPNLGLFPEILNWTDTVKSVIFDVQVDKNVIGQATRLSPDPDPELWKAIFQPDSPVIPFRFPDLTKNAVIAFPVKHVQTFVAQQYINMAVESPEEPPPIEKVLRTEALGQIRLKPITQPKLAAVVQLRTTEKVMSERIRSTIASQKVKAVPVSPTPEPPKDFYLLRMYHQPRNRVVIDPKTKRPVVQRAKITPPELDFHQAISYLSNYPALMRLLGLAIDFEIPLPAVMPKLGSLRVLPRGRTDQTPWTRFSIDVQKGIFAAASRSSKPEIVDGFLDLSDDEKFDLIQIDVDGVALKTAEIADKAEELPSGELPALRSSGLGVIRTGNAVVIAEMLKVALDNNRLLERREKKDELIFYAEDLIQGYRVDVWEDRSKKWRSLFQRVGSYKFLRIDKEIELEDEGFISENASQAADESSDDLFTHESLFNWNGWSLAAPRPGKTIDENDQVAQIENRAATAFRLETKFKPKPGSLPRLRFGWGYRLRARAVDLAGNSLPPDVQDDKKAIPASPQPPFVYSRFDPVPPPVVVPRQETKTGETVDDVLIRSFNDTIEKDTVPAAEIAERHIVPPKTSQLMAEVCGMFDAEAGLKKDVYNLICAKDPGKLQEIEPGEAIELPYFPDPWAKGVIVRGLPGYPADKPLKVEFIGDWPDIKTFRLRVEEGNKPAVWDSSSRVLTVYLKKSDEVTLWFSCYFPEPLLTIQGLYKWLEKPQLVIPPKILQAPQLQTQIQPQTEARVKTIPPTKTVVEKTEPVEKQVQPAPAQVGPIFQLPKINLGLIKKVALDGSFWMMTPFRAVTLRHAVQQPIGKPGQNKFAVVKKLGETSVQFDAELRVHGPSTNKFDLLAKWQEPVDNPFESTWKKIDGSAHVIEASLDKKQTSFVMNARTNHRHEFGDTKYRKVTYRLVASSRFKEQMPPEISENAELMSRQSDPFDIHIPNSAPPALPKVLYVLPTFGWERKRELTKYTSIRKGGGLRVYLERPWFSSGDGELLGVVLPPTPKPAAATPAQAKPGQVVARPTVSSEVSTRAMSLTAVPEAYKPYITLWGLDPIWKSGRIGSPEYPLPEDFKLAKQTMWDLPLLELPDTPRFTVVGHEVAFDEERKLWYCDIDINPHDAYYPFIRLSLARFQPVSVSGAHLSRLLTADFIQLAPDRTVSAVFNLSRKEISFTVGGSSYVEGSAERGPGQITVELETKDPALPEELGWTPVPKSLVTLTASKVSEKETGKFIWSGTLKFPDDIKIRPYRIAVREYEIFDTDEIDRTAKTVAAVVRKKFQRLVFAENIPIIGL